MKIGSSEALSLGKDELQARLPNLIVIGAAKCGTSALHGYLAAHPEIGMSSHKELMFFGSKAAAAGDLTDYAVHFPPDRRVRGESSPSYTMWPFVRDVPEQMAQWLDEPRFLYIVGEPVERIAAHWAEQFIFRREQRPFEEALAELDDPANPYICASRYGTQLGRYLSCFPAERILVLDQRDLRERRQETLSRVFRFAGVDPAFDSPEFAREPNVGAGKLYLNDVAAWLGRHGRFQGPLRRMSRHRPLSLLVGRRFERPEVDPDMRKRLADVLRDDIATFRYVTGREFAHWSV